MYEESSFKKVWNLMVSRSERTRLGNCYEEIALPLDIDSPESVAGELRQITWQSRARSC